MKAAVMIVDDESDIRSFVQEYLGAFDIPVVAADGATSCIQALENGFSGVILMDVMMPECDGWETIRKIVDNNLLGDNIILMQTAIDTPDERMDGLQEYVIDYITKPLDPKILVSKIKQYFEVFSAKDQSK